jgi:hypothetical protein
MTKKSSPKTSNGTAATAPAGLPLFYKKPVALDKKIHADMALAKDLTFDFAAHVNAVPVTMIELPNIMQFYPVAFSSSAPATPLAILGLRDQENLFVTPKGDWAANTYIPAYIRRYPFIFAKSDDGDRLTLCIDDTAGIMKKGKDNTLFDASGEPTELTKNALEFCRSYQIAAEQTLEFSNALEASGILIDRHAEIRMNDGRTMTLTGFRQIDEKKYYELPQATIKEWHDKRWTRFVYAHLFSIGNWQRLFQMVEGRMGTKN